MACLNVTVVIVNFNSGDNLWRCLNCLSQQTENPRAVIIVDNGSDDDSISKARDRFPNFKFIEVGSNLGFAAANNFVFSLICTDYVALLNPDAFPEPTWLANLVWLLQSSPLLIRSQVVKSWTWTGVSWMEQVIVITYLGFIGADIMAARERYWSVCPTTKRYFRLRWRCYV